MFDQRIRKDLIDELDQRQIAAHEEDLAALKRQLQRRGIRIEPIIREAMHFSVALPSWGFAQGGTRFGRFARENEPQSIEQKMFAAALVNDLTGVTPRISLHIPWDTPSNPKALRKLARQLGLGFDAMNSNTFQDQPGQQHSYKFGSLSHIDPAVRAQAIEHNVRCIEIGQDIGSQSLVVWLADGANFPGQHNFRRALDRTIDSLENIYSRLPPKWKLLIEYKPFEPAFYSTVIHDWGTAWMVCQHLGEQAECLVDLGHHLPNTAVEVIVARLIAAQRLGGFHFNDSKYADDDLSSGSIRPYQLFLIFNELVDAATDRLLSKRRPKFNPAYMIDIDRAHLPDTVAVNAWSSEEFLGSLRHDPLNPRFNPHLRQLLHVGYKIAAKKGERYLSALREFQEPIARNVTANLFERHMKPLLA